MSLFTFWRSFTHAREQRHVDSTQGSVRDELMFHFRELVNEEVSKGATHDKAWDQAEKQFGSLRQYENECHAMRLQANLIARVTACAILFFILVCAGWSRFEVGSVRLNEKLQLLKEEVALLRDEQIRLLAKQTEANEELHPSGKSDLVGLVLDQDKRPLRDATVLVILKTWPDDEYRQEDFATKTDAEGRFQLPGLMPASSRYAVAVAAVKDEFAFHSFFHLKQTPDEKPEPIMLQLEPSSPVTLVVRDDQGVPMRDVKVVPLSRELPNGDRHNIYFQGSDLVRQTTDERGRVQFHCFRPGDSVEIYVRQPGRDWDLHSFEIPRDGSVVDLASTAVALN